MEVILTGICYILGCIAICYILGYIVSDIIFLVWVFHEPKEHEKQFDYKQLEIEREEQIEQDKMYFMSRAVNKEEN